MTPLALEEPPTDTLLERIPDPALNALVTVPQAAEFLGIPEDFVVDLTKFGLIPCLRSGDSRFIRFSDLVEYRREWVIRRQQDRASPLDKARDMIVASGMRV